MYPRYCRGEHRHRTSLSVSVTIAAARRVPREISDIVNPSAQISPRNQILSQSRIVKLNVHCKKTNNLYEQLYPRIYTLKCFSERFASENRACQVRRADNKHKQCRRRASDLRENQARPLLPNATLQFPRREVAKVVPDSADEKKRCGSKKSRDRFLASRSDLIKDAVRTARQTDPGGGEEGSMKGETTRGVPEGRNRPLHSRDA